MNNKPKKIGFLEVFFGLLIQPGVITREIFKRGDPPYSLTIFLLLVLTIFVPVISQITTLHLLSFETDLISFSVLTFLFMLMIFLLLEGLFLHIFSINVGLPNLVSALAYALVPLIVGIWMIYGANFAYHGRITLVTIALTGYGELSPQLASVIPIVGIFVLISSFLIYTCSIQQFGELHFFTALVISVFSIIPFVVSLAGGSVIASHCIPQAISKLSNLAPGLTPYLERFFALL